MLCVAIDGNGVIVEDTLSTAPNCAEYMLATPQEFSRLTFFADLAETLDMSANPDVWEFYLATLLTFILAFGVKQVVRLILNR